MKSILQAEKECWYTGETYELHKHHIFGGANRKNSEKYGLWVWLRPDLHNMSDAGVHFDREKDLELKQTAQAAFEQTHSREEFMRIFGRNWL